ncbi:MAG: radical SAM protein, partial [Candidatus Omnitrophota bacterium]
IGRVFDYVERARQGRERVIDLGAGLRDEAVYASGYRREKDHGYVVISTGCSNHCAYCLVPYVRGELCLRPPQAIIGEIKANIARGIKRVTLLGQNVNDYYYRPKTEDRRPKTEGHPQDSPLEEKPKSIEIDFAQLLKMVSEIEGLKEVGFITAHPKNTSGELFRLMASCSKIKKRLHIPFRSGSDRILASMKRGYSRREYLDLVGQYRDIVPGGELFTDVIVGFPGEREQDFRASYDLMLKVRFNAAYIFKYSPRPHTPAEKMRDDVSPQEKQRRHSLLLELQKKISRADAVPAVLE